VQPHGQKGYGDDPQVIGRARRREALVEDGPRPIRLTLDEQQDAQPTERDRPRPGTGSFFGRTSDQVLEETPALGVVRARLPEVSEGRGQSQS
jgi:hypothetical protein